MPSQAFPRSFLEFARRFPDEEACFRYIIDARWPDGFVCEKCGHNEAYAYMGKWTLRCKNCRKVHSATAGTVMHRTRQPLCTWLWAAYLVTTDKRGISAVRLQEQLEINRYETAFNMLHKLRAAMVNPDREPLRGTVEVDETYIGGSQPGKRGRGAFGKALVVGAVEIRNGKPARVRFRKIPSGARNHLFRFVVDHVAVESTVITDANPAYRKLIEIGYNRRVESTAYGADQDDVLPHFHVAVSNLKRWLLGTHHGAVSQKHLQAYLNEFAFRYNRRRNLWAAFQTLLGLTDRVESPTYEGLYTGTFQHKNPVLTGYNI